MSSSPIAYDLHGVVTAVSCSDAAVLEAVDERLRGFPRAVDHSELPDVRVEFVVRGAGEHEAVTAPSGPSRPVYDTPYGELSYFDEVDVLYGELAGVALHCTAGAGIARVRAPTFTGRELYLAVHPLLTIALMELLERRGRYSVHAACLARGDGQGVLLAGPSGAGKSTLALALALDRAGAGLAFLSDDVVFIDDGPDGGDVRVLGFADTLGVTEGNAERFRELAPVLERPLRDGFPKRLVRIEDALPAAALQTSCEPRALVFTRVAAGEPSAITPLDPGEAWLRLVPDVLLTQPAGTQAHLAALAALLAGVRTYELRSGTDLDRAAQLVVETLQG